MDATVTDPLVGRVVDERYRVVARLARGGMATVYEAVDLRLERTVALKVMHASLAEDDEFVTRFVREARSAARLSHPNVVAVYDQGTDGDVVYLVMEYVPSLNLREVLRDRGRLTVQEAFDVIDPVLAALGAAHAAGIVHRDVKPENVLLAQDGRVLVADFGLARATSNATAATTQGVLIGTVAYLAPEQVERGIADPRSDVYAAGIVLYEMLTGAPPFAGETPLSVAYQHVNGVVPPPSRSSPEIPTAVDALVGAATSRDPDDRYSDATRFLDAERATRHRIGLVAVAAASSTSPRSLNDTLVVPRGGATGLSSTAVVAGAGVAHPETRTAAARPAPGQPSAPRPKTPEAQRRRRRRRGLLVVLVVLAIAAAIGAYAFKAGATKYSTTPAVATLTQDTAGARIRAAGLVPEVGTPAFSETVAKGRVIRTDPGARERVKRGSTVVMTVSRGPERYDVPKLAGLTEAQARSAIAKQRLALGTVAKRYSDSVKSGVVISSSPAAGTTVRRSAVVDLVVSKGPAPVTVPKVSGTDSASASAKLASLGLKVTTTSKYSDTVAKGTVISQSPAAGTQLKRGDNVALVVSKGPAPVAVPNVIDQRVGDARRTLEALGFKVETSYLLSFGKPLRIVRTQSVPGGSSAPKGSTITLGYV